MTPKKAQPTPGGEPDHPGVPDVPDVPDMRDQRDISDPRTMRALAHPVRLALLEALRREGPLTATRAAELLDDSPGQYVLAPSDARKVRLRRGGGRWARPQPALAGRGADRKRQGWVALRDPEFASAEEALEASVQERSYQALREWRSGRRSFPPVWLTSAFSTHGLAYLTAEELKALGDEIVALLTRYNSRLLEKADRPPDALPVHIFAVRPPSPAYPVW